MTSGPIGRGKRTGRELRESFLKRILTSCASTKEKQEKNDPSHTPEEPVHQQPSLPRLTNLPIYLTY